MNSLEKKKKQMGAKLTKIILILFPVFIGFAACQSRDPSPPQEIIHFDFEKDEAEGWQPNFPGNWRVSLQDDNHVYELIAPGEQGRVRAPRSWSVLSGHVVSSFELTGRLLSTAETDNSFRDLCIFFHYQDPTHFYYCHLSARSDEFHNIIGLVNGADRVKINHEPPGESASRLTDIEWHRFKVIVDSETGDIRVYLDDLQKPILTARDSTIASGLVGVGSFDDTGCFDDITLKKTARK